MACRCSYRSETETDSAIDVIWRYTHFFGLDVCLCHCVFTLAETDGIGFNDNVQKCSTLNLDRDPCKFPLVPVP